MERKDGNGGMDFQTIVNFGAGIIIAGLGWFSRQVWDAVKELRSDLQKLEVQLPTDYVSKADFTTALEKINKGLDRIYDKLDGKADK